MHWQIHRYFCLTVPYTIKFIKLFSVHLYIFFNLCVFFLVLVCQPQHLSIFFSIYGLFLFYMVYMSMISSACGVTLRN